MLPFCNSIFKYSFCVYPANYDVIINDEKYVIKIDDEVGMEILNKLGNLIKVELVSEVVSKCCDNIVGDDNFE